MIVAIKTVHQISNKSSDDVCEVNNMLQNMSTADDKEDNDVSVCANCGKEGNDVNNTCNKCKQVKYCNAVCKKIHKKKHKKECEEYIKLAAEKHDEELFKQPPPLEDCSICFLRIPCAEAGSKYYSCCGKMICSGCAHAPVYDSQGNEVTEKVCPFCRVPHPISVEEAIERITKRMEVNDAEAMHNAGNYYINGRYGFPQDYGKALELFHRAAKLDHAKAYCCIGYAYKSGEGVKRDMKKAEHYTELAAIKGNGIARFNLGIMEAQTGNMDRALKHYLIAVRTGYKSLNDIKHMYTNGHATKEDYTKALLLYQEYLSEIKSTQRDKAAAADERFRYY